MGRVWDRLERKDFIQDFRLKTVKGRNQLEFAGVVWRRIEILMLNMLDWIKAAHQMIQWRAVLITAITFGVHKTGNYATS